MLVDTSIFIDFFRGNGKAKNFFEKKRNYSTSVLCVMEVIAGFPKLSDREKFEDFLTKAGIKFYYVNDLISKRGFELFKVYHLKAGISIPDALIAATAMIYRDVLVTLNIKHFRSIKDLSLMKPY
ncbi:hypothetical protein A2767_01320 [Candidatus Roizmanbacteria bacterium RIFCSPHIGHO2_01_FULL_35_10]|uniref:PIN domain-containing protein n=1 Tax=Candidatus Roizmanbacteria bacterium RIFCSPLOWO2_01_FULL_35_13 TaxID=1802055 RepID=A0A1F7I7T1_9BACT|nr:MAG: hypothetical protein A2767_01320 [Candidatus Roizmanbacteria bacterium RIFCSPHIGHO2_01_FULL_35_10]OGK39403.1 MAG: hypothetical protein A3A74_06225 [Candidatus Roizmanbacteria bacterium RIFCSPLOWO2_01_FULL_35_13]